jgi:hypothetical protein
LSSSTADATKTILDAQARKLLGRLDALLLPPKLLARLRLARALARDGTERVAHRER